MATRIDASLAALSAIDHALAREYLVLRESPKLLWQQMHNRLAWNDSLRGTPCRDRLVASHSGSGPWMRLRAPLSESNALKRTLAIHDGWVYGCAFSPDGTKVALGRARRRHQNPGHATSPGSSHSQGQRRPGLLLCFQR